MRFIRLVMSCAILPLLIFGCIFSPKRAENKPPPPPPVYLAPTSPQNVLENMLAAYVHRDSVEYKLVFDQALYVGESTDQTTQPITSDSLRWGDEARHISRLARDPDILRIDLQFPPSQSWITYPSGFVDDPPGSVSMTITRPTLTLYTSTNGDYMLGGVGQFEYRFAPTVSGGETTWKIIHWTEVRQ